MMDPVEYKRRFEEQLGRIARDAFRLITSAAIVIFLGLVPVHYNLSSGIWRTVLTGVNAALALGFVAVLLVDLRRPLRPATTIRLLTVYAILLAISNMVAILAWRKPEAAGFDMLLLLALAYFILSTPWYTAVVGIVVATFELAVWLIGGGPEWMLSRLLLLISVFVSYVVRVGRFQNIRKLLDAQIALTERTHQLQRLLRQERRNRSKFASRDDRELIEPVVDDATVAELEAEIQLREALLTRLSRDVNTPLTAILGFTDLLLARTSQPDLRQFATWIRRAAYRLAGGITTALDLTRLEFGDIAPELAPRDVKAMLSSVAQRWGTVAEDRGIELRTFLEPGAVLTDRERLERILDQLLEDAIRSTHEGWVALSVTRTDNETFVIEVRDTADHAQLPAEMRRESEMTLRIAARLIDQMGGRVEVLQDTGGRVVRIGLPLTDVVDESNGNGRAPDDTLRILVVDDDPQCLRLVREVLGEFAQIATATTPDEAIEAAKRQRYDLALLDINLKHPTIDGTELLQQLRRLPGWKRVPILALTAYALKQDRENFLDLGFDGYIAKPFTPQTLAEQVARFLPVS